MADIKKTKLYEVHILLNAKDHVIKNVTKNSTCDDVIKSLHRYMHIDKENGHVYALYESMYGVDRELSGKTKVHKLLRAWGSKKDKVQLVLRRKSDIGTKPIVSTPKRGHQRRHDQQCYNCQGSSFSGNENMKRLSRIVHLQKQRMRSIMESHSKQIVSQEANVRDIRKLNPGHTMFSNDLTIQEINRYKRREQTNLNKKILSPKIPHSTPMIERNNFVTTAPKFAAVKFANSKPLQVKHSNETTTYAPLDIGTRPPCIGQVDPESFGNDHSRHMGDGEYSYYIEEAYSTRETKDRCLFFLDKSFRSESYLDQRQESFRECSALDIGFLEDTLHSFVNRIDIENGMTGPDKDYMHHSKDIFKLFEKSVNTEIPCTDDAKSNLTNGKHNQQGLVDYSFTNDESRMAETENILSSPILKSGSLNVSRNLVDYSFSDNESVLMCADDIESLTRAPPSGDSDIDSETSPKSSKEIFFRF